MQFCVIFITKKWLWNNKELGFSSPNLGGNYRRLNLAWERAAESELQLTVIHVTSVNYKLVTGLFFDLLVTFLWRENVAVLLFCFTSYENIDLSYHSRFEERLSSTRHSSSSNFTFHCSSFLSFSTSLNESILNKFLWSALMQRLSWNIQAF